MFAEAGILIDDELVKLIDITLEQWKQFEEYMKIKRRLEVNGINTDLECDPTNVEFQKWKFTKNDLSMQHEIMYGQTPPLHIPYMAKDCDVEIKQRFNKEFQVSDWVYLKLQPYRLLTIRQGKHHKLSSKYFRPFQVIDWIGKVTYKLRLSHYAKVHPVFHVSQLKPCYVEAATMGKFSQCDDEGLLVASPLKLLERKLVKQNNRMVIYGLI
uniref:Reverse transcriptase n=1 Tax=Tanacetum cinerariifolium TaxID=118510 RepID=A0A699I4K1_TANCI|nr:reverse transcriptase [Tanacetum cinerariifolium]